MNRRGHWPGTEHIPMDQPDTIREAALWLAGVKASDSSATGSSGPEFGVTWGPGISVP